MSSGSVEVKTRGLDRMKTFISESDRIPKSVFPLIVLDMRELGVAAGKASIRGSVGINSTGNLENSFEGVVKEINQEHHQVEIGSDLDDHYGNSVAKFVSLGTAQRQQNSNVQVAPTSLRYGYLPTGIWKFIGTHPGTKPHPFMQDTESTIGNNLDRVVSKYLRDGWKNAGNTAKGAPPTP